jgi:hypothetical protein
VTPSEMRETAAKIRALSPEHERALRFQGCLVLLEAADVLRQLADIVECREKAS